MYISFIFSIQLITRLLCTDPLVIAYRLARLVRYHEIWIQLEKYYYMDIDNLFDFDRHICYVLHCLCCSKMLLWRSWFVCLQKHNQTPTSGMFKVQWNIPTKTEVWTLFSKFFTAYILFLVAFGSYMF